MNFKECIEQNHLIETGDKDINKAKEIVALAKHKLQFWKEVKEKSKKYPSVFVEGHYEIVKELATVILLLDGWKADNHDCLFQYLIDRKQDLDIDFTFVKASAVISGPLQISNSNNDDSSKSSNQN